MRTPRTSVFTNVWVMGKSCQLLNLGTYPGVRNTNARVLHITPDAIAAILDSLDVRLWRIGIWESPNLIEVRHMYWYNGITHATSIWESYTRGQA
jgi:hypothetical protein